MQEIFMSTTIFNVIEDSAQDPEQGGEEVMEMS